MHHPLLILKTDQYSRIYHHWSHLYLVFPSSPPFGPGRGHSACSCTEWASGPGCSPWLHRTWRRSAPGLLPPTQLEQSGQSAQGPAECSHEVNKNYLYREQWVPAARPVRWAKKAISVAFKSLAVSAWRLGLWSIRLSADAVLTWSGGRADTFQGAELCYRCLHVGQEAEGLSRAFLHGVLAVGSHQLLQSRPELPSLQEKEKKKNTSCQSWKRRKMSWPLCSYTSLNVGGEEGTYLLHKAAQ